MSYWLLAYSTTTVPCPWSLLLQWSAHFSLHSILGCSPWCLQPWLVSTFNTSPHLHRPHRKKTHKNTNTKETITIVRPTSSLNLLQENVCHMETIMNVKVEMWIFLETFTEIKICCKRSQEHSYENRKVMCRLLHLRNCSRLSNLPMWNEVIFTNYHSSASLSNIENKDLSFNPLTYAVTSSRGW